MVIVSAADDKFALPLGVTLYSALANLSGVKSVSLYIIDGGINEENKRKLTEVLCVNNVAVNITWLSPNLGSLDGVKTGEWTAAAYFRLLIPTLLPRDIDRAIYLDSDLVIEHNLKELWTQPIGGHRALAVQDYTLPFVSCGSQTIGLSEIYKSLALPPETPYFNSGVMLIDLNRWREDNIALRALEYTHTLQRFDQDALNATLASQWGLLDPRWNVLLSDLAGNPLDEQESRQLAQQVIARYAQRTPMSESEMQRAQERLFEEPFILHFTGYKPWHFIYKGRARERWFRYLQQSGWFGPVSDVNRLMRHAWDKQNEYEPWLKRLYSTSQELASLIPGKETFILVDEDEFRLDGFEMVAGCRAIPFLEQNGEYWGTPPDNATAVQEFERLKRSGANFMVFTWPAFWWLDHYQEFNNHLRSSYRCVLQNRDMVVFDLRLPVLQSDRA